MNSNQTFLEIFLFYFVISKIVYCKYYCSLRFKIKTHYFSPDFMKMLLKSRLIQLNYRLLNDLLLTTIRLKII